MKNDLYEGVIKTFKIADTQSDIILVVSLNEFDVTEFDSPNDQKYYLEILPVVDQILISMPAFRYVLCTNKNNAMSITKDIVKNINCAYDPNMDAEIIRYKNELFGIILYEPHMDDDAAKGVCQVRFTEGTELRRDCKSLENAYGMSHMDISWPAIWYMKCNNKDFNCLRYGEGTERRKETGYKGIDMPVAICEADEWNKEYVKVVHIDNYAPVN